ncbi:hypothetical protein BJ875DRAFT_388839 [Amylocarpus encephaloides]|uniref:Protein kinase domain-containing protein n=1 Tax=Amylocarpus encephaloides TaxID=45428 RepID=A0A9P7Y7T3_9HELO|nr:hypothetical protein BJ875DRAFT_388839 [Amylocarpus encephaloides]
MTQPVHRHLRRVQAFLGRPSENTGEDPPRSIGSGTSHKARRIFRVLLQDPWDDYTFIRDCGQTKLALRKASSFQLAEIREVSASDALEDPLILCQIIHPNIATINEIYCCDERIFYITEYLEVSFAQLGVQRYDLKEREIATIIAEVLKGIAHISSLRLSCKDLSQENIRLSLDGCIKLG